MLGGLGVVSQVVGTEMKKKEIEKKKENSKKAGSRHHVAACRRKFSAMLQHGHRVRFHVN